MEIRAGPALKGTPGLFFALRMVNAVLTLATLGAGRKFGREKCLKFIQITAQRLST